MALDLDFSDVERNEPLEDGDYVLLISDVEIVDSKDKESQNLKVKFEVTEPSDANGKGLTQFMSLKPKALWKIREFLEAVIGEEIEGNFSINEEALPGQTVGATLTQDGKYSRVETYFSV